MNRTPETPGIYVCHLGGMPGSALAERTEPEEGDPGLVQEPGK